MTLESTVLDSTAFRATTRSIRLRSIRAEFPSINWIDDPAPVDWAFALLFASALTSIESERAQTAVLRVASGCMMAEETSAAERAIAAGLLERSGNRRSAELGELRGRVQPESWADLPPGFQLDVLRARLHYSVPLSTGVDMPVNRFQGRLWSDAASYDWISVSAPTSAGKSRIVRELFLERARTPRPFSLVYVVPTRALIEEVSRDFRREAPPGVGVFALPWDPDLERVDQRILILTQERLHLLQESHPHFPIDLLFIDEAQSLGGPDRGVLLQQVIDRAISDSPEVKVLFASPLSSNPELLVQDRPDGRTASAFTSEAVTVNQNLLRVERVAGQSTQRTVSLVHEGAPTVLGTLNLPARPTHVPMRIAYVAFAMSKDSSGNVVYANGADDAEKIAKSIYEQLPPRTPDEDIENLRDLVTTAVHPKYALADVLSRGVAFHYGNMPLAIRTEIERLFSLGKILYLVCTSTLLEGVNLPCRTLYVRNPQKGRGRPMEEADFWNLAGRAGRWGQEFEGNIVCVDTDDEAIWPNLPAVRTRSFLRRAVHTQLRDPSALVAFLRRGADPGGDAGAEHVFSYLCSRMAAGTGIDEYLQLVEDVSAREEIAEGVAAAVHSADFPRDLIPKHAGISPIAMQSLLDDFRSTGLSPEMLALPLPEELDARSRFQEAFVRLGRSVTTAFGLPPRNGDDKRKWQLANLVVNWMNGMPLARLIDQRASREIPIARAIRDVMSDIESVARFQAPKYLTCYGDILAAYAAEHGMTLTPPVDFSMLLELGVSRPSEVVLMAVGLSRTATLSLSPYVGVDSWTTEECLTWLRAQNIDGLNIPVLIQREIQDVMNNAARVF